MLTAQKHDDRERVALADLLRTYSVEITAHDEKALKAVESTLAPGTEVFIANLPDERAEVLVAAALRVRRAGLEPVPHIVARNLKSRDDLDGMLASLVRDAGVSTALILGGDRDRQAGNFENALQIIETGLLEAHGIRRIAIGCYPEGHPRIPDEVLWQALRAKLDAAARVGLETVLVSQFLFDPQPLIEFARALRREGIDAPLRVGVAGPADRTKLIRYALRCGVGASLRVLRERGSLARNVLAGETPDALLGAAAVAQKEEPELGMAGVHFFTFGDPAGSARWAEEARSAE
jgi:5,10-methylenetetrahydrofolate reductase